MTTVTTAPEAEYWLQTGRMEEPDAELGIRKPVTVDRKTNLHEHRAYWCVRRAQDIFFSLLALIALSPLMLLTCIAVWIDSPGASPVFSQLRVGRNGKLFRLYKFRSMCPNAESKLNDLLQDNEMDGPVFKMKDDPRITRVGHFIRKTSIDELPQLVNILKGDMSIVGPRPALPREVAQYTPYEWQRLYVTPGLSCYWQIAPHRNQLSFEEWMALDVKYVKERSFLVDWKIIFATFRAAVSYTHLTLPTTSRVQRQMCIRDSLCNLPCGAVRPRRINFCLRSDKACLLCRFLFYLWACGPAEKNRGTTRGRPSVFA